MKISLIEFFLFGHKNIFMNSKINLTLIKSNFLKLREDLFGHEGVILTFKEGFIAKKDKKLKEIEFYHFYNNNLKNYLPINFIPKTYGLFTKQIFIPNKVYLIELNDFQENLYNNSYLLMEDLIKDFEKPSILDLKLGFRTWGFNIKPEKKQRLINKSKLSTSYIYNFKIRSCLWYSQLENQFPQKNNISFISRNSCSIDELLIIFKDFFHFPQQINFFIKKINDLINYLILIKNLFDIRFYSSSILFYYDELNQEKFDCRLIDFGKTFLNVSTNYNENFEENDDKIIEGLQNIIKFLKNI